MEFMHFFIAASEWRCAPGIELRDARESQYLTKLGTAQSLAACQQLALDHNIMTIATINYNQVTKNCRGYRSVLYLEWETKPATSAAETRCHLRTFFIFHEFRETSHSVTFYFLKKDS